MKIYLYLKEKILIFSIPSKVSGSFSFDENPEEESKLINIEVRGSKLEIYSTMDVSVIVGGTVSRSTILTSNNYYILQRNEEKYLIYVTELFDNSFLPYLYNNEVNMIVGNEESCNVNFPCQLFKGVAAKVFIKEGKLLLETANVATYINNISITSPSYEIKSGDQLNIYGLKIVFLNGFMLINNPMNNIKINLNSSRLASYQFKQEDSPKEVEIKDVDLYNKNSFFLNLHV